MKSDGIAETWAVLISHVHRPGHFFPARDLCGLCARAGTSDQFRPDRHIKCFLVHSPDFR